MASADFYERKAHFLQSVPYALKNLRWLRDNVKLPIALPALLEALDEIANSEKLQSFPRTQTGLTVRIFSFSFHGSVPADDTGNGGGFVFDARSLPNPGREEHFRAQTGKDASVIEYLDREESVARFLSHVYPLVDASVANYRQRGFSSLMVSFGCTGGQHRSVYLAEHLAQHLRDAQDVEVVVRHIGLEKLGKSGEPPE
jgi:RNase adaptor protein for sRNA GlmZ degradation